MSFSSPISPNTDTGVAPTSAPAPSSAQTSSAAVPAADSIQSSSSLPIQILQELTLALWQLEQLGGGAAAGGPASPAPGSTTPVSYQVPANSPAQVPANPTPQVPANTAPQVTGTPAVQPASETKQGAKHGHREEHFGKVTASSKGDPHETLESGKVDDHWNNMASHGDLLDSNSFGTDGLTISSQATAPNAKHVTRNQSVTVSMDGGQASVTVKDGSYSVTSGKKDVKLKVGQTVNLGHGDSVTLESNKPGAERLKVTQSNGKGAKLDETLEAHNGGVNLSATGSDVNLGGYLVTHKDQGATPASPSKGKGQTKPAPAKTAPAPTSATPSSTTTPAASVSVQATVDGTTFDNLAATIASLAATLARLQPGATTDDGTTTDTTSTSQSASGGTGASASSSPTSSASPTVSSASTSSTPQTVPPLPQPHHGVRIPRVIIADLSGSDTSTSAVVPVAANVKLGSVDLGAEFSTSDDRTVQTVASAGSSNTEMS
jgi:hypothetical protein